MEMKINLNILLSERNKRAWTQGHLADVCGLSLRTIQRIEKSGQASQESIQAFASVFDLSIEDLLLYEKTEPGKIAEKTIEDKIFMRLGIFFMLIVPMVALITLITGSTIYIDTSVMGKPGSMTATSSTIITLFKYTNIVYYTYLPAVICFCISIWKFNNKTKKIKLLLALSSFIVLAATPFLFGMSLVLLVISLLVYTKKTISVY